MTLNLQKINQIQAFDIIVIQDKQNDLNTISREYEEYDEQFLMI